WHHAHHHKIPFTDAFGMSAKEPIATVELQLTLKAYNLLMEEHPQSKENITVKGKDYLLKIPIADFHGVGRFVLGLPGEVQVIGSEEFVKFLNKQIEKFYRVTEVDSGRG